MPWKAVKGHGCSGSKPWAVIRSDTGKKVSCHATEEKANDAVKALYAQEDHKVVKPGDGGNCPPGFRKNGDGKCVKQGGYQEDHGEIEFFATDKPWDGAASRFTDEQYQRAAAACDPASKGTVKERCFLPHHEPDGTLNSNGVHNSASRISQLKGRTPEAVSRAKSHLRSHYGELNEEPPDSLAASAGEQTFHKVEAGGWEGTLVVEGKTTGDGREFAPKSLTWADMPLPLKWMPSEDIGHGGSVIVGRIDKVWRDGELVKGKGVFDLGGENGQEAHRLVKEGFLKGVSIDVDDVSEADIELIFPEQPKAGSDDDDLDGLEILFGPPPEKMLFHHGRIRAATLTPMPAFVEASISLVDVDAAALTQTVTADGLVAHAAPESLPPPEWFQDPKLSVPTPITVSDDGRIYGHAAQWGTCHVGHSSECVQPPREPDHPYFMTGEVLCSDGSRAAVGQITVGTGHAPLGMNARRATDHYDNTGTAVADVAVGNDTIGIWVAGAIRDNVDGKRVHELRASGQVSGDWRRIGGTLRLVGLLAVNVPGFPVPQPKARVISGRTRIKAASADGNTDNLTQDFESEALVGAGRTSVGRGQLAEDEMLKQAWAALADKLSQQVHSGERDKITAGTPTPGGGD